MDPGSLPIYNRLNSLHCESDDDLVPRQYLLLALRTKFELVVGVALFELQDDARGVRESNLRPCHALQLPQIEVPDGFRPRLALQHLGGSRLHDLIRESRPPPFEVSLLELKVPNRPPKPRATRSLLQVPHA
eukprot:CAMPEP_0115155066 /NCGR_PEP_ID=MMETSP0227-20121206/67676_1 /TAXON_ID=89957 /ORGANISM="Polarella glacialis, Strain CCMP 1383" /LENGTH=131 /DNA_ID=CAMNT_0002566077 /DNA_START=11 /DNA_END=402 /DNA_ORIENTATION=+